MNKLNNLQPLPRDLGSGVDIPKRIITQPFNNWKKLMSQNIRSSVHPSELHVNLGIKQGVITSPTIYNNVTLRAQADLKPCWLWERYSLPDPLDAADKPFFQAYRISVEPPLEGFFVLMLVLLIFFARLLSFFLLYLFEWSIWSQSDTFGEKKR